MDMFNCSLLFGSSNLDSVRFIIYFLLTQISIIVTGTMDMPNAKIEAVVIRLGQFTEKI